MPVAGGPKITKTGILLDVDAADTTSYPGSGTTWTNNARLGSNNGTLNNISFDSTDSKGALIFTGSNTYVDFGNIGDLSSAWSFQVAFKPAPTSSGDAYTILSYASGSDTGSLTFKLDYSSSTQEVILSTFSTASATAETVHAISGSVASGSWNIVHGTFGSSLAALYVNGLGQAYQPTTGSSVGYNASNQLYAGGTYSLDSGFYTGSMANVTVNNADLAGLDVNKNYNAIATRFSLPVRRPTVTDADAFNFVEAAGISSETQAAAINDLVLGLKANNLWTKMQAIYPFVGGSAFSHKYNLKNPSDTDAAYRILWFGPITHFNKGVSFQNSETSYGDTNFAPFTALDDPLQSNHLSVYVSGSAAGTLSIAGNTSTLASGMGIGLGTIQQMSAYTTPPIPITVNGHTGLAVVTRTSAVDSAAYVRGSTTRTVTSTNGTPGSPRTGNIFIGKENGGWPGPGPNTVFNFSSIGTGLTTLDVENLYIVVHSFNTSLNRAFNQ